MTVVKQYWRAIVFVVLLVAGCAILHHSPLSQASGPSTQGLSRRIVAAGAVLFMLVFAVQWLWNIRIREATGKAVFIACLALAGPVMLFLLPPFQGPDEPAHWRNALMRYRADAEAETALFNLPEILDAHRQRFVFEEKFNAAALRRSADNPPLASKEPVTYAGIFSYPSVAVVAFFFPRVRTTQESLLFYYLCRAVPFMLLIALLYYIHSYYQLPYTFVWFLALPLVLQASLVITADTIVNIGLIVAVLLMLRVREKFSIPLYVALVLVCLILTYAKFVVGGILLLPLLVIPPEKIPMPKIVIPLGIIAIIGACVVAAWLLAGHLKSRDSLNTKEIIAQRIDLISSPGGLKMFLRMWYDWLPGLKYVAAWSGPLGWLDTPLGAHHMFLIKLTACIVLLLDAVQYGPRLPELLRTRWKTALAYAAVALIFSVALSLTVAAVMFIVWTPPELGYISGLQVRYYFGVPILAFMLFLGLFPRVADQASDTAAPGIKGLASLSATTLALTLLPLLMFARTVELCIDLLVRYW